MMLLNFITCSLFQVFFGSVLFLYVACECEFPENDFPDGTIIYMSPSDVNETFAEDMYILQFQCSPGYELIGRSYIQCVDGEWTPDLPFCAAMECSKPPDIQNATYRVKSAVSRFPIIGSYALYKCKGGYELEDEEAFALRCVLSRNHKKAIWAGKRPSCREIMSCPDPGVSNFGGREGNCCLAGSSLEFYCNEGYELVGEEIIHCLPFGNWTSLRPLCKPFAEEHCELPPIIPHGIIIGDKEGDYYVPEEEAQVVCEPGYKCEGLEFVLCEEGGEWESEFGECKEIFCDPPPPLANGTILELQSTNLTSFPYNFELTYVCDENYRLIGDSWRICGKRGWTGKTPFCEVTQCPDPGIPENGYRTAEGFTVDFSVRFSCFEGYELLGSLERLCLKNGQWSGELARCNLPTNYCPNPGIPIKGSKNSTNYDLGSKIGFRCQDGYTQVGSEVRECLADHTWSGTEMKCLGQYDFDSEASLKEKLRNQISRRAEEQKIELEKYKKLRLQRGKSIDLNYPGRIILYFMFDVSGSVGNHNFKRSIDFAKAIVKKVGISENGARAGALIFGTTAEQKFLPLNFNTTEGVLNALDEIEYTGGGTATSTAFTVIKRDFLPLVESKFGKTNVKSIIFLITDGKANMGGSPAKDAKSLRDAGIEIYCIGITGDVRKQALYDIASKSKTETGEMKPNVYILKNYATLSWLVQEVTNGTIDYSECGLGMENVGNKGSVGRIIGGQKSKDPWPWMAALFMKIENEIPPKYELKCGGSIIHRNFILTAAHCFYKDLYTNPVMLDKRSIIIKLGLTDTKNETYVQEFEIREMFIHPKYRPGRMFDYDIALLRMERPAEYNAYVRPICLPPNELPDDSPLYRAKSTTWAIGFGQNASNLNRAISENLREVFLPIQSKERCINSTVSNDVNASFFTERMFCAGDGTGKIDTCQGDSGGPTMQMLSNSEGYVYWTQIGIVSWGIECGLKNTYGYYTNLQKLVPWVHSTIENSLKI